MPRRADTAARDGVRAERRERALALRGTMSPTEPAPDRFRVATWNVNSLKARRPAFARLIERARPDVICLQETKAAQVVPEVLAVLDDHGYTIEHVGAGGYNGVAIAARHPLSGVEASGTFGDEHLDREPRLISAVVDGPIEVRLASVYVPHGREVGHWHFEYKLAFLDALRRTSERWLAAHDHVLIGGDLNVAPTDSDVFHPDAFAGVTHVTPEERSALAQVVGAGLVDLDAARWGARARRFTWWNHGLWYARNLGMRIDGLLADRDLAARLDTTWIDHIERGSERPSDHAALIADFHLDPPRSSPSPSG